MNILDVILFGFLFTIGAGLGFLVLNFLAEMENRLRYKLWERKQIKMRRKENL